MGPGAAGRPPRHVLAQLGLQLSGGEAFFFIPRLWSPSVSGDVIANRNCPVWTNVY